jgi:hypothetical protein
MPDVRGLYRFYEELALRFAERGYVALAFDYYGRTAGGRGSAADDLSTGRHADQTKPGLVQEDVRVRGPQSACVSTARPSSPSASCFVGGIRGSPPRPTYTA